MLIIKILLYGIYIMFLLFTLFVICSMIYKILRNILVPPFYCDVRVLDKKDELIILPVKGSGVGRNIFVIIVELSDYKVKKFKVDYETYEEIEVDKKYRLRIKNDEVIEYMSSYIPL